MSITQLLTWSTSGLGGIAAIYGLHRLALWLEERGYLYYLNKKPSGSAAGCFVALQRAVEPQAQHVLRVHEEVSRKSGESAGEDKPPSEAHHDGPFEIEDASTGSPDRDGHLPPGA